MNKNTKLEPLDRLLRSAALSWDRPVACPSYEMEMRVMVAWRGAEWDVEAAWLNQLFRRGVVLAVGLSAIAVAASLAQMTTSPADELEFSGMMVQFVALR